MSTETTTTEQQTAPTTADPTTTTAVVPAQPEPTTTTTTEPEETTSAGAEAAKYRTRLRAAEGERDGLRTDLEAARGRLEAAQRREVQRLAGDLLAVPDDVFAVGGVQLDELVADDGAVDEVAVLEAATALLEARPGLAKVAPRPKAPPNHGSGYRGPMTAAPAGWDEVLRPR